MDLEKYRPRYHFTPPRNWMNDPNGLIYNKGEYHLFYQHNPYETRWGHMSWGHAVSSDLVHWQHLSIAILEEPEQGYTIFSGSVVIDYANSSGLGQANQPPMVAIYTADFRESHIEDIHIAYSNDRGRTFTKYAGNPVIAIGERKFGDPKVFWHAESDKWMMVNICGWPEGHVVLYASSDLKAWEYLSEFHAQETAPAVWECPDLFPLMVDDDPHNVKWVLKTNFVKPGKNISGTRYFVGDFDGTNFTRIASLGGAFTSDQGTMYAEVTYNDTPDARRVLFGWLQQQPHEGRRWTGAQSLPRALSLHTWDDGFELRQTPTLELQTLRKQHSYIEHLLLAGKTHPINGLDLSGGAVEIIAEFEVKAAAVCEVTLHLADGNVAAVGYDSASNALFVDRSEQERIVAPLLPTEGKVKLHIFFDQDILEVFGGNGKAGITTWLPFGNPYQRLTCNAQDGSATLIRLDAWQLT